MRVASAVGLATAATGVSLSCNCARSVLVAERTTAGSARSPASVLVGQRSHDEEADDEQERARRTPILIRRLTIG